jgi:hypothetical protein
MKNKTLFLTITLFIILGIASAVYANQVTGTITTWEKGSQMSLPVEKPLKGAEIIFGKDIWLQVGQTGTDTVKGQVVTKTVTDDKGNFSVNLPPGKYTMIIWKARFIPSTHVVNSPGNANGSINPDTNTVLHTILNYSK